MDVRPFTVNEADEILEDLRQRLARTRWPDEVENAGWNHGVPLAYLQGLLHYWQRSFDWRPQERRINSFANYGAEIDGFGIHFVHERGRGPNPVPILISHGWPSSFVEMLDLIPLLGMSPTRMNMSEACRTSERVCLCYTVNTYTSPHCYLVRHLSPEYKAQREIY